MLHEAAQASLDVTVAPHENARHWYAVYTRGRHEKAVYSQLVRKRIEVFLPAVDVPRRWSDRWKTVSMPLFPGYLFVQIPYRGWLQILKTPGVVSVVGNHDGPVSVPERELEAVRHALESELKCDPHPFLTEGQRVCVVRGSLQGVEGILLRKKSQFRLVLSVELIRKAVSLEIDAADVRAA